MRRGLALLAAVALLLPRDGEAQRAVTVRADNDAFNFWQFPWSRPDEEYTSGVRVTVDYAGAAPWARGLSGRGIARLLGPCAETNCTASHSYALGQDIYTAVRLRNVATAKPGGRPDAGVLWFTATTRVERPTRRTELGFTVGATGALSLAEPMQRFFHDLAPRFNRPIAWGPQVPTEPVFAASLDTRGNAHQGAVAVQPHLGASLGNLITEARAGVGVRLGRSGATPWDDVPPRGTVSVALVGDASLRAVARNEVLNGAFFRTSARVTPRPLVSELELGVRLQWRMLEASWLAHQTSAEYTTRAAPHVWSMLQAAWYPGR